MNEQLNTIDIQSLNTVDSDMAGLSMEKIVARMNKLIAVKKALMHENVHYGTIPGSPKPSLWKAGAELLACTFKLSLIMESNIVLDDPDLQRQIRLPEYVPDPSQNGRKIKVYKDVIVTGYYEVISSCKVIAPDGTLLAHSSGTCNSCEARFNNQGYYDVKNSIMKRAEKRAMVGAILIATGGSGMFLEDEDGEGASQGGGTNSSNGNPPRKGWLSEAQKKLIWARAGKKTPRPQEDVTKHVIQQIDDMGYKEGKKYFDQIANELPESENIWRKAAASVAAINNANSANTGGSFSAEDDNSEPPLPPAGFDD